MIKSFHVVKKILNFSPFYLWIIGSHTLQATQLSMWMTGTYIQIKEVIAPPWKIYWKTFMETIGWVILDCGMKIVYMYCWKKLCTAICRKLSENCICKYALCPGIKKINPQCLFQHVTYYYKCIKIIFPSQYST